MANRDKTMSYRLSDEVLTALREYSDDEGRSLSQSVARFVRDGLRRAHYLPEPARWAECEVCGRMGPRGPRGQR